MLKICILLVLLVAAIKSANAVLSAADCTSMETNAAQLGCTLRRVCPSLGGNPAEWEPLTLTKIGTVNTKTTNIQNFRIPSSVPASANEVFVYLYIKVTVRAIIFFSVFDFLKITTISVFFLLFEMCIYHHVGNSHFSSVNETSNFCAKMLPKKLVF